MVNANRILTVSYGTFSCTLEGFDEPFSTMKSIAEYFRDLAADDRYFGAEPPTPDAEMLHRIAEREIQRRVESRISETGIVLRQTDEAPDRANLAPPARAEAPAAAPKPAEAPAEPASFSDKLQRIRAVAARPAERGEYVEDEQAEAFFVDTPIETAFADIDEDAADATAEVEEPEVAVAEAAPDDEVPAETLDDTTDPADYEAQAYAPDDEDTFAGAAVVQPVAARPAAAPAPDTDDAAISAVLGSLGHPPVIEETDLRADHAVADDALDMDATEDEDDDLFAEMEDEAEDWDDADDWEDLDDEDDEDDEPAMTAQVEISAVAMKIEIETTDREDDAAIQPRRPVARVIKVRRATAEEARQPIEVPGESTLSDEDEAELAAELAEVQADAEQEAAATDPLAIETDEQPADRIAPRKDPVRTAFDDVDMSETDVAIDRILEKTNTQLKSGEATRRRSAIQHLKAAVQATRADREAAGEIVEDDDPRDAYLEDLARVVRPRRPGAEGETASRRMAPLVLVSEQRIDERRDEPAGKDHAEGRGKPDTTHPVRPRRVTKGNLALSPDLSLVEDAVSAQGDTPEPAPLIEGFRHYLEDSDAEGTEEMFEAALAFVTQEVGRANATRPQLMTLVMNASSGIGREDALNAFSVLLRDGRIERVKRGQFVLGEASRFFDPDE